MGSEEISERYRRRADSFERLVAGVGPGAWSAQSPCAAWNAREVVDHVVGMHRFVLSRLDGPGVSAPDHADPSQAFVDVRCAIGSLLVTDAAQSEVVTRAGPMPLNREVDEVLSDDLPIHGWDLATTTGQDATIDLIDVALLWRKVTSIPEDVMAKYRTPGAFGPGIEVYGPEVPVEEGAPLQDRLLGMLGRDPAWTPPSH